MAVGSANDFDLVVLGAGTGGYAAAFRAEADGTLWTAARHTFVLPEEQRRPEVKDSLRWEFARSLTTLERRLGDGKFLMGSEMTVPDIIAAHCLSWAMSANFPVEQPTLLDYHKRMTTRPAYLRMISRATS